MFLLQTRGKAKGGLFSVFVVFIGLFLLSSCFGGMLESERKGLEIANPASPQGLPTLTGTLSLSTTPVTESMSAFALSDDPDLTTLQAATSDDMAGYEVKAYDLDEGLLLYEGESDAAGSFQLRPADETEGQALSIDEHLAASVGGTFRVLLVAKKGDVEIRKLHELEGFDPYKENNVGSMDGDTTLAALLVDLDIQESASTQGFALGSSPLPSLSSAYDPLMSYTIYTSLLAMAALADVKSSVVGGQLAMFSVLIYQGIRESRLQEVLRGFQNISQGIEDDSETLDLILTHFAQERGLDPALFVAQLNDAVTSFRYVRKIVKEMSDKGGVGSALKSLGPAGWAKLGTFILNVYASDAALIDISKIKKFFQSAISEGTLGDFSDSMAEVLAAIAASNSNNPLTEELVAFANIKSIDELLTCRSSETVKRSYAVIKKVAAFLDTTVTTLRSLNGSAGAIDHSFLQSAVAYGSYDTVPDEKIEDADKAADLTGYLFDNKGKINTCKGNFPEPSFFPSPADGGQNVPLDILPSVVFTEKLDPKSVLTSTFYLMKGNDYVSGNAYYTETIYDGAIVGKIIFQPVNPLSPATQYTLVATQWIENFVNVPVLSEDVVIHFTTVSTLALLSRYPEEGTIENNICTPPYVEFNNPLNCTTVADHVTLEMVGGGAVSGAAACALGNSSRAVFYPQGFLSPNTTYVFKALSGLGDTYGQVMASDVTTTFTTGTECDSTPPVWPNNFIGLQELTPVAENKQMMRLGWYAATDDNYPQGDLYYHWFSSSTPGGQDYNQKWWSVKGSTATCTGGYCTYDTWGSCGDTYYVVLRVRDQSGSTYWWDNIGNYDTNTQELSVTLPMCPPSGFIAAGANNRAVLTWSATNGATGYAIYRDGVLIATTGAVTTYTDNTVTNGNTYYYKMAAVRSGETSSFSEEIGVTPMNSVEDGVIGYWRFDGDGMNDIVESPDAVTVGGAYYNASGGQLGGHAHVTTGSDYLTIPYQSMFDLATDFTIEFWFRQFSDQGFLQSLVYKGWGQNNYNFYIFRQLWNEYNFGPIITGFTSSYTGWWTQTSNPNQLTHGVWHHVAYTKSATGSAYYLDGQLIHASSQSDAAVTPASDIYIATSAVNTDIDNLRIYNRSLSQSEVLTNFYQDY